MSEENKDLSSGKELSKQEMKDAKGGLKSGGGLINDISGPAASGPRKLAADCSCSCDCSPSGSSSNWSANEDAGAQ